MSQPVPAQPPPTAPPGRVHLNSLAAHKHAPAADSAATFNPSQRSATTTAAVSSTVAIAFGLA